jgi:ADP-ribose pyrophosphatase YjhB (NUDIX family)
MKSIISATLIEKNNKFLLVNAKIGVPKGLWNNPGGHKEKGETEKQAAVRETEEETGFEVKLGKLIGVYTNEIRVKKVWQAKIVGGKLDFPTKEISAAKWFTAKQIVKLNTTKSTLYSINDYQRGKFYRKYHI